MQQARRAVEEAQELLDKELLTREREEERRDGFWQ